MNHRKIIEDYYLSYKKRDRDKLRNILTPGFRHISEFAVHTDRDRMIEEIWPHVGQSWSEDLQIFGDYPEFMVRFKVVGGDRPSRSMAEYIRFEGDKIAEVEVFMGRELK
ncbi:MAG: hypothetical protein ACFCU6_10685 [Balneolaceae bacterium]